MEIVTFTFHWKHQRSVQISDVHINVGSKHLEKMKDPLCKGEQIPVSMKVF